MPAIRLALVVTSAQLDSGYGYGYGRYHKPQEEPEQRPTEPLVW